MEFAFAIIVGLLGFGAGLGGSYALLEKRLNAQERSNQSRLNQEQAALEQVYQERLQATKEELKAQYETRLQQLEAQLTAPGMAQDSAAVAAVPVAEVVPEEAAVAAVPVVGIAPEEAAVAAVVEATPEAAAVVAAPAAAVSPGPVATVSLSPQAVASQVRSPEAGVRLALAQTLAAGLGGQSPAGVLQAIGALGQLSRDLDPQVRYAAIVGLGQVKSPKVLPFLRRGLRDSDGVVVKAASGAIDRFRSTAKAKPAKVKIAKKAAGKAKLA